VRVALPPYPPRGPDQAHDVKDHNQQEGRQDEELGGLQVSLPDKERVVEELQRDHDKNHGYAGSDPESEDGSACHAHFVL